MHTLMTSEELAALLDNGARTKAGLDHDPMPVLKFFTPDGSGTWLISELDPDDHTIAYGLADLGLGTPEIGLIDLSELMELRGRLALPVEKDLHFKAKYPLSVYHRLAVRAGAVIT